MANADQHGGYGRRPSARGIIGGAGVSFGAARASVTGLDSAMLARWLREERGLRRFEFRQYAWVNPIQLYTWPLYRSNYVYGKLLALAYHDALASDAGKFRRDYHALLSSGYDAPPALLLSRSSGLELTPDTLVDAAHRVLQRWIRELEIEYARTGTS